MNRHTGKKMDYTINRIIEELQDEPGKTFRELREQKYPVTTLIGSSKYPEDFRTWTGIWGLMGHQVWSICISGHTIDGFDMRGNAKRRLDAAYMAKIRQSDQVFVVNGQGYIGLGTQDELLYALSLGKQVGFAERFRDPDNTRAIIELARREGYVHPEMDAVFLPGRHYYRLRFARFDPSIIH